MLGRGKDPSRHPLKGRGEGKGEGGMGKGNGERVMGKNEKAHFGDGVRFGGRCVGDLKVERGEAGEAEVARQEMGVVMSVDLADDIDPQVFLLEMVCLYA